MDNEYYKDACTKARVLLRTHLGRSAAVENLPLTIKLLELKYTGIRSASTDQTPVQGGGNTREEALNANIMQRDKCKAALEEAKLAVEITNRALSTLTEEEQHVLEVMYITRQRGAAQRLREEYCFQNDSSVYKIRDRALDKFVLAAFNATRHDTLRKFIDAINAYRDCIN